LRKHVLGDKKVEMVAHIRWASTALRHYCEVKKLCTRSATCFAKNTNNVYNLFLAFIFIF